MIRTHLVPETNNVTVPIPDNYIGKKVEVIVFTDEDMQSDHLSQPNPGNIKKLEGFLTPERAIEFQKFAEEIRNEWERNI